MYLYVLLLPLLSFISLFFFGKFIDKIFLLIFNIACLFLSLIFCLFILYEVAFSSSICIIPLWSWANIANFDLTIMLFFDPLTALMLFLVLFVSSLVHLYSLEYMESDPHLIRFMSYLSLFTFFMLVFVTAGNFLQMFIGWEGVGLSSYLLINFWYTRINANKAAMKAIIVNRISDSFLYLGILLTFFLFQTLDYSSVFSLSNYVYNVNNLFFSFNILSIIVFCFFIGAMGKSAQIGLHTWLPDAMEGPTPVSALIHAATMVTAGVFLLIRCSCLLEQCPDILILVLIIGSLTAVFAGSIGGFQNDIKKIIAYSTCSQLGYMVFVCGLSHYSVSFFHLFNHGFFKALLFLGAGSIIHSLMDEQDIRRMGAVCEVLPVSYMAFFIGSLALMGFPFLTGFYSKDLILELSFSTISISGIYAYWLGVLSAFFTAFYSYRLFFLVFFGECNVVLCSYQQIVESELFIPYILISLSVFSIFIGFLLRDMIVGLGTSFWSNTLYYSYLVDSYFFAEFWMSTFSKNIPLLFTILGMLCGVFVVFFNIDLIFSKAWRNLVIFLNKKWFFDQIYNIFIVKSFMQFSYHITFKLVDKGLVEFFGSFNIVYIMRKIVRFFSLIHTGFIQDYLLVILLGFIFIAFCSFPFINIFI